MIDEKDLRAKYEVVRPLLDERQRRLVAAADAVSLGRGGVSKVARASGLSRTTIHRGMAELREGVAEPEQVRKPGGGRKAVWEQDPRVLVELEELVDPETRGDPMSPLRWTCKSTRELADGLADRGYQITHPTVATLLHELGYSLQANAKTIEGKDHPDRDAQFRYINEQVLKRLKSKLPAISVDTKKKELIGQFKNAGQEWRRKRSPRKVKTRDFVDLDAGKGIPYGVYDIGRDLGWVNVGCDHDTANFAIESIRRWWTMMGRRLYPKADKLLICADSGGSNGYRLRLWKAGLQRLADALGLDVTVCHFPPGTSKWNKIEHRLFSHIAMNWRGQPLTSHEVIVDLIAATETRSGLKVKARLDRGKYPTKLKVSDEEMASLCLKPHSFHGDWNYTLKHRRP